jgi:hypothetical protein
MVQMYTINIYIKYVLYVRNYKHENIVAMGLDALQQNVIRANTVLQRYETVGLWVIRILKYSIDRVCT